MNFKPTVLKVTISLIIAFLFGAYIFRDISRCVGSDLFCVNIINYLTSFIYFIIALGLVYIIWSLIQKKK
jgi:hypothetical protein